MQISLQACELYYILQEGAATILLEYVLQFMNNNGY